MRPPRGGGARGGRGGFGRGRDGGRGGGRFGGGRGGGFNRDEGPPAEVVGMYCISAPSHFQLSNFVSANLFRVNAAEFSKLSEKSS